MGRVKYIGNLATRHGGLGSYTAASTFMHIDEAERKNLEQGKRKKLAICYGAGMDSTIALFWATEKMGYKKEDIVLVHVDYGAPHSGKEWAITDKISRHLLSYCHSLITIKLPLEIPAESMGLGYIVPSRNALLAAIGAAFGDQVWIVANYRKIDDGPNAASDKSRRFYLEASSMLSRMYNQPTTVISPFLHMSKADTIVWFLAKSGIANTDQELATDILSATTTCYDATDKRCGTCFACMKLYKSLCFVSEDASAGDARFTIPGEFVFTVNPRATDDFNEYVRRELGKGREVPQSWKDAIE